MKAILVILQLPGDARCEDIRDNLQATAERLGGTVETIHAVTEIDPNRALARLYSTLAGPVHRACANIAVRRHIKHSDQRSRSVQS